jgi:hypothetical protein
MAPHGERAPKPMKSGRLLTGCPLGPVLCRVGHDLPQNRGTLWVRQGAASSREQPKLRERENENLAGMAPVRS